MIFLRGSSAACMSIKMSATPNQPIAAFAEADNAGQHVRTIRSPHNQASATVTLTSIFAALPGASTDHAVGDGIGAVRPPALLLPHYLHCDALQQWAGGATMAGVTPACHGRL